METTELLRRVALFEGLNDDELRRVAQLCREARYQTGQLITQQGQPGVEMFIVREGVVEVRASQNPQGGPDTRPMLTLGAGQVVGEMALVDGGRRSASVRCASDTTVNVIEREAFERLCQSDQHIGMVVYRNLAAELSFKLRHFNLARR
ncbi:MAG: cyclic nucleotide-binding domain-containing protein [Anaerolineales bacterium]